MKDAYIKTASIRWKKIQDDIFEKKCVENKKGLNISILRLKPYQEIPLHKHLDTRYNYILEGGMSDGNEKYGKGDILINKKGSKHFLKALSRGCEFLLIWD
jgi:anti-sigma factor ChrR (cupin superfamily)